MLAVLNKDIEFIDSNGNTVKLSQDTVFIVDCKEGVAYLVQDDNKDHHHYFSVEPEEYSILN